MRAPWTTHGAEGAQGEAVNVRKLAKQGEPTCGYLIPIFDVELQPIHTPCMLPAGHKGRSHVYEDDKLTIRFRPFTEREKAIRARRKAKGAEHA